MSKQTDELTHEEWKSTLEYLKNSTVEEILEGTLEIRRIQSLTDGGWSTTDYTLVLATGGPHKEVTTGGRLSVSWSSYYEDQVTGDVRDKLDRVFDHLHSLYVGGPAQ